MEGCSEFLSAAGLNSASQRNSRDRIKKEASERKRNVLYLIFSYLRENNLNNTAECLITEAQLSNDYEACDNIDLDTVLQEYQSYYYAKFNKTPKIVKINKNINKASLVNNKEVVPKKRSNLTVPSSAIIKTNENVREFQFEIRQLLCNTDSNLTLQSTDCEDLGIYSKSLCDFEGYSNEWREMADIILKEIVPKCLKITWNDCVGLQRSTELLKEAVIYPIRYPSLFSGLVTAWRGILLYGPPGTGKTLLSRAVAYESKTTFFNVTSSCFVSKWRGESEKMIKVLFDLARYYAPSTIFIDELDAIACNHNDYQHDASRRFKSELLTQMDGILKENDKVFVLATTNKPWDLDAALLRRFEKRILVDLPGERTRDDIFKYYFAQQQQHQFVDQDFADMAKLSADFSASDIRSACREACMRKLREGLMKIEKKEVKLENWKLNCPSMDDVIESIQCIRPVTNARLQGKYLKWHDDFGCH